MSENEEIKVTKAKKANDNKKKQKNNHNEEIEKLKMALGAEVEKSMRIQAEMMNFRKRKEEELSNFKKYANEDMIKSLLPIIDNFERALLLENEENKEFLSGFKMIYSNIMNILESNGVSEIEALNKEFDPNLHQAVATEKVDGVDANIVIDVLQKGYLYKDKVVRASMVRVSE